MFSVKSNGVNLVNEGEGAVLVGDVAELLQGADCAVHRVDRFKGNDLSRNQMGLKLVAKNCFKETVNGLLLKKLVIRGLFFNYFLSFSSKNDNFYNLM